jgi:hypothetical protein
MAAWMLGSPAGYEIDVRKGRWLPSCWGWVTLAWMRRREYV